MLLFQVSVPESDIYGVTLAVGEKRWLPFTIEIPPNIVSPMVVSNKKERAIAMVKYHNLYLPKYLQVGFLMPAADKRPILHATDVKFDKCAGVNVLCIEPHVDLRRNYGAEFSQTTNISTFMSVSFFDNPMNSLA
jgi:hypothetical protein